MYNSISFSGKYILFDAAATLIYKPQLSEVFIKVLSNNNIKLETSVFLKRHKLLSEIIKFPDVTNREFYHYFNSELLLSFGIVPNDSLLVELFNECSYLPWETFSDVVYLNKLPFDCGVLSNFSSSLNSILKQKVKREFKHVFISEELGVSKPDISFFLKAISEIGLSPSDVLYVGDSIKLDMIPGQEVGFQCVLIDREDNYPNFENRILSLSELNNIYNND